MSGYIVIACFISVGSVKHIGPRVQHISRSTEVRVCQICLYWINQILPQVNYIELLQYKSILENVFPVKLLCNDCIKKCYTNNLELNWIELNWIEWEEEGEEGQVFHLHPKSTFVPVAYTIATGQRRPSHPSRCSLWPQPVDQHNDLSAVTYSHKHTTLNHANAHTNQEFRLALGWVKNSVCINCDSWEQFVCTWREVKRMLWVFG